MAPIHPGKLRPHITRRGAFKTPYTEEEARLAARRLTAATRPPRPRTEAYRCPFCAHWHIGRGKRWELPTDDTMRDEIGPRAWWNLYHENYASKKGRLALLANRMRRCGA